MTATDNHKMYAITHGENYSEALQAGRLSNNTVMGRTD